MRLLPPHICQLIVETGLAAVNHGLPQQAESVRLALPHLTDNHHARLIIEASLLIGQGYPHTAQCLLQTNHSSEAQLLRRLIHSRPFPPFPAD